MRKRILTILLIVFISLILDLAMAPLRAWIIVICSIVAFIVYFFFTCYALKRWKELRPAYILCAIFLGWAIINIPLRIVAFEKSMTTLPDALMHVLGMIAGYAYFKAKSTLSRWGVIVVSLVLLGGIVPITSMWYHHLNFGSFIEKMKPFTIKAFPVETATGDTLWIGQDPDKIYVLDFWTRGCGICFQQFPEFQDIYDQYKEDKRFVFCAVNGIDDKSAFSPLLKQGYTFPVGICQKQELEQFGITVFPTYCLVVHNQFIYKGNKKDLWTKIKEL